MLHEILSCITERHRDAEHTSYLHACTVSWDHDLDTAAIVNSLDRRRGLITFAHAYHSRASKESPEGL